ncbi:type VI secretion system membrane subunit TssM [Vibrio sp. S4M6]|uniref:type VI secretion system membrane subunit TssM n=1 Tax=Vibrio sinus TaxID=2946865 RepID=UPI00202AB270|nr:type VI secretion system membrane subunit TssM [Vibrio sinus]MCL9781233.1 type VI secretion system membrane subunit TssM [Vibrio sinus]
MTKKILYVLLTIVLSSISGALWIFLPEDSFFGLKMVFTGATVLVCLLIVIWWVRRVSGNKEACEKQVLLKQDIRTIRQLFLVATRKIRGRGHNKLESFYDLPWYLVIGSSGDAKSTILQQNGFESTSEHHQSESATEDYLTIWSDEKAVVIEVGPRVFDGTSLDQTLWHVLSQQILKYRPQQGLNGIISVFGCDALLRTASKEREKIANLYQKALLSMNRALKLELPVYSVFSKADAISDFIEFFASYSGADIENPFGVTLKCEASRRFDRQEFDEQYQILLGSLAEQKLDILRTSNVEGAASALALPYQLRIFFERMSEFLADIGRENRVREAVWIRGAYLLSSGQKGTEFDLLTQTIADRAEFNSRSTHEQLPGRRSCFSRQLFSYAILPEKAVVGMNKWRHAGSVALRITFLFCIVVALVFSVLQLKSNWLRDDKWRTGAIVMMNQYRADALKLKTHYSTSDMIAVLDELRTVAREGVKPKAWYKYISARQDATSKHVFQAYQHQLALVLLPNLEQLMKSQLTESVKHQQPAQVFTALYYYQMLFDHDLVNTPDFLAYLVEHIKGERNLDGNLSSADIQKLSKLVEDLFNSHYEQQAKPDRELIHSAVRRLQGLSPARLIYSRIQTLPQYGSTVDIRAQLGANFSSLFCFSDGFHGYLIPNMFTKRGYGQLDLGPNSSLLYQQLKSLKEIEGDKSNVSVTERVDLSRQIQKLYLSDYIHYWKNLISNIHIRQFSDPADFASALKGARDLSDSPILDVLDTVVLNTTLAHEEQPSTKSDKRAASQLGLKKLAKGMSTVEKLNQSMGETLLQLQPAFIVNQAFKSVARYVNGSGKKGDTAQSNTLIHQLDTLNTYFYTALSNTDSSKAFFDDMQAHVSNGQDAIKELQQSGSDAPDVVARWTKSIAFHAWRQVVNGSVSYLDEQWDAQVYQFYVNAIDGHFPFATRSRSDVSLDDFALMFKPHGLIDEYVNQLLTPFVYWDDGKLMLQEVDGVALPMSKAALQNLEIAKKVSTVFFGQTGKMPELKISLRASIMSANVTKFSLRGSGNVFSYNQGPKFWREINWPTSDMDGYLSADFYQGDKLLASQSYKGQWALLRFLFNGKNAVTTSHSKRKVDYKLGNEQITINYKLDNSEEVIDKSLFSNFRLQKQLL